MGVSRITTIKEARDEDIGAIRAIISMAFDEKQNRRDGDIIQSLLFDELLKDGHDVISLVAVEASEIIGHVLVSPVFLKPDTGWVCAQISPLSVHPNFQSKGIGSALMEAVIAKAIEKGLDALFLLGNPNYYRRFGFVASKVHSAYGPSIYFQELILNTDIEDMGDIHVSFAPAFIRLGL